LADFDESANDALNHRLGIAFACVVPLRIGWNAFPTLLSLPGRELEDLAQRANMLFESFPRLPWNVYYPLDRAAFLLLRDMVKCAATWVATDPQHQTAAHLLDCACFWSRRCGKDLYDMPNDLDMDELLADGGRIRRRLRPLPDELLCDDGQIVRRLRCLDAADSARLRDVAAQMVQYLRLGCDNDYAAPRHLFRVDDDYCEQSAFAKYFADQFAKCSGNPWIEMFACEIVGKYFLTEVSAKASELPLSKKIRSFVERSEGAIYTTDVGNILEKVFPRV
jgi:hypothetical protein